MRRISPWLDPSVESLLESPIAELSLDSNFSTVPSIVVPRVHGKYKVHQIEPLYLVSLDTSGRSPGIPDGAVSYRLTHYHSSHRHGTHTVGMGTGF
jgi:hypothetical protein